MPAITMGRALRTTSPNASASIVWLSSAQPSVAAAMPECASRSLQADRGALPALLALTEHSQPVHRAKAVVAAGLLCRDSPVALLACCEVRPAS